MAFRALNHAIWSLLGCTIGGLFLPLVVGLRMVPLSLQHVKTAILLSGGIVLMA